MNQRHSPSSYRIATSDLNGGTIIYWLERRVANGNGNGHDDAGWSRIAGSFERSTLLDFWRALDADPEAVMPIGVFRAGTPNGFIRNVRVKNPNEASPE